MADARTVERAERLKELHASEQPLVLPTVWDVWSARTAADAGFRALTIGSHPLAESRGAKDGEGQTLRGGPRGGRARSSPVSTSRSPSTSRRATGTSPRT